MKYLYHFAFALIATMSANAQVEPSYYEASKQFLNSTHQRYDALTTKNIQVICNATNSSSGIDTKGYYLAFEILEDEKLKTKLIQDTDMFFVRNLVMMYQDSLPLKLHQACLSKNDNNIIKVMLEIQDYMGLE